MRSTFRPRWRNGRSNVPIAPGWRSEPGRTGSGASSAMARPSDALTQAILNLALESGRPVAILSGNSIEHALMTQAAMQARISAAPVSPAYSLQSHDHAKLKYLFDLIRPALVMVQDGPTFEKALKALNLDGVAIVHVNRPAEGIKSIAFADLVATPVTKDVEDSIAKITP